MANKDDSNSQDIEETKKVIDPESVPKLPTALPAGMEEKVNQLKTVSQTLPKPFFNHSFLFFDLFPMPCGIWRMVLANPESYLFLYIIQLGISFQGTMYVFVQ